MMGKDSVCWSWDERLKEKGKVLCKTLWAMKPNVFSFLHSLQWWVTFSFFENYFRILKSALISTRNPWDILNTIQWKRTITVERNWFNPCKQMKTTPIISTLICWSPGDLNEVKSFQGQSVYPQLKAMVWHFAALEPSALHVEKFSKGNFGCI